MVALTEPGERRTRALGTLSFMKFAGYALLPGLSIVLSTEFTVGSYRVHAYNFPALLLIVLYCLQLVAIYVYIGPDVGKVRI